MTDIMLLSDNTLQFSAYRPVRGRDGGVKIENHVGEKI